MRALSCAVGLSLFVSPSFLPAQADSTRHPEVRTSGTAQRSVQPDLATVSVQLSDSGATPAEAGARLAAKADSLRRALAKLGIPADSLVNRARWYWWRNRVEVVPRSRCIPRTAPRPGQPWCDTVIDTTYRVNDAIEIRIHDLKRVGAVLDTLLGRWLTNISDIRFSATDVTAARDQAVREATTRARAEAEAVATAGGMVLGRVLLLTTEPDDANRYGGLFPDGITVSGASAESSPSTVVTAPAIQVSVTVYGRWELMPKP